MVSKASEDLPEPDRPGSTTRLSRGMSTSTFLRLCSRAPRTRMYCMRVRYDSIWALALWAASLALGNVLIVFYGTVSKWFAINIKQGGIDGRKRQQGDPDRQSWPRSGDPFDQ